MIRFTVTFKKDGEEKTTKLFADDAKAAIDEFLTNNNRIEPKEIVSVTSQRPLIEEKDVLNGEEFRKERKQAKEENKQEKFETNEHDESTPDQPEKTDWSLVIGVSLFLAIGIILGIGVYLKDASFTLNNLGDSYASEWDSYPVNFRSLREDSENKDDHIVQGTNFAIKNRYGYRDYVQENKDGTRWAMVTSLSNRLAISSWKVDCDEKKLQVEYSLKGEPERWTKPEIGTQGFAVAATICQIPFTPSY